MEDSNKKLIDDLNHLVTICNDGKYGYETAAEDADSAALRAMFSGYSAERAEFTQQLKEEIRKFGGDPDHGGGPLGAIHRAWIACLIPQMNPAVLADLDAGGDHDFPGMVVGIAEISGVAAIGGLMRGLEQ